MVSIIFSRAKIKSRNFRYKYSKLSGQCHKEGTQVAKLANVRERKALQDYTESIHGIGLYKSGLTVTAVCTSCHSSLRYSTS